MEKIRKHRVKPNQIRVNLSLTAQARNKAILTKKCRELIERFEREQLKRELA